MKNALEFLNTSTGDITSTKKELLSFDGNCTSVVKHKTSVSFIVNAKEFNQAMKLCNFSPDCLKKTDKLLLIQKKALNLTIKLPLLLKDTQVISNKGKKQKLPSDFKDKIKLLVKFVSGDSDNLWAESLNIINNYVYATNNVVVVRSKLNISNCMIPKQLLERINRINITPTHLVLTDKTITILYDKKGNQFIQCPIYSENAPEIDKIFDVYQSPKKLKKFDRTAIMNALSMEFDDTETLVIKKGVVKTRNTEIDGVSCKNTSVSVKELSNLLKIFDSATFGKEMSFFTDDNNNQAIMASRV